MAVLRKSLALTQILAAAVILIALAIAAGADPPAGPGSRVIVDAHNCYPYNGRWSNRIERALSIGLPVAIEQDLFWYTDPKTGLSRSIDSHGQPIDGLEPAMREYFFERIRPIMEQALRAGNTRDWPLITLNLDFKSDEPAHHAAVWKLLGEYEGWLCTAKRGPEPDQPLPLTPGPLLVLSGEADTQQHDFYDTVPVGGRLRVFGAAHAKEEGDALLSPQRMVPLRASNYRRWWNNPWKVIETGGQPKAGEWTPEKQTRLKAMVAYAHTQGYWIRFYTLNGHPPELLKVNGWDRGYNFGSRERVELRWRAAMEAGVDFIATDQYEDLAKVKASQAAPSLVF